MRVCVTGCAGFIGLAVASRCLDVGIAVEGIDALVPNEHLALKQWRLQQIVGRPGFRFHPLDITDRSAVEGLLSVSAPAPSASTENRFDGVIHLAAVSGAAESIEAPFRTYRTNVLGTLSMLEACRKANVGQFVLASSASVYGEGHLSAPGGHVPQGGLQPSNELDPAEGTLSPYAASKTAAEGLCKLYHRIHGLDIAVLRYFTPYGPAGRPDMSVLQFIQRISEGRAVQISGEGNQVRDYCYVDDVARGTLAALDVSGFEIINLGGGRPIKVIDMLACVEQLLGKTAEKVHLPPLPNDVAVSWADIDKARAVLGWTPTTSLVDGLRRTIAWHRSQRARLGDGWMGSTDS